MKDIKNIDDYKVASITVTYNRLQQLKENINSIRNQSRVPNLIVVVNNGSTDGTSDWLKLQQDLFTIEQGNVGGAGGFYSGMKYAYEHEFDFLWMMDDDGFAEEKCLEKTLYLATKNKIGLSGPIITPNHESNELSFGFPGMGSVEKVRESQVDGILKDYVNPFNGTLIHRSVIEKIGFIKKEMFIWGDEKEYLLRSLANDIKIGTFINARYYHPRGKGMSETILDGKVGTSTKKVLHSRYLIKTYGKIITKLINRVVIKPNDKMGIYVRNIGYINSKYYSRKQHWITVRSYCIYYAARFMFKEIPKFLKYYYDGYYDKYVLPPSKEFIENK